MRLLARSRSQLLIALTVICAGAFGVAVWDTVRGQHDKVVEATCHYAADAARVALSRSRFYLQAATAPLFAAITRDAPPPSVLAAAATDVARCHCAAELPAHGYFKLDVNGTAVDARGTLTFAGLTAPVDTLRLRQALARTVSMVAHGPGVVAAAVTATDDQWGRLQDVSVESPLFTADGHLRAVYGILIDPRHLVTSVIEPVYDGASVFSWWQSDTNRYTNKQLAALAVFDFTQHPLTDTLPVWTACYGLSPTDSAMANIIVYLDVRPPASARWAAQYTSTSQFPLLVSLLAATLVSGAGAAVAARREAELAALRADFVTSVSHELRMPLAQILISGETLSGARARTQDERDDAADAVVREAQRLTHLVDNVLHFSRIEHHNVTVSPEHVEMAAFIGEIVCDMAPLAASAGVCVGHEVPPGTMATLDPRAFRQVFYNLLDNAMKYGPRGQTITVGAQTVSTGVRMWVEDQGSGIPPRAAKTVFEPFVRLARDRNRAVAGSGLGLAVVRELVRGHKGRIRIESAVGGGARFVIDLPTLST